MVESIFFYTESGKEKNANALKMHSPAAVGTYCVGRCRAVVIRTALKKKRKKGKGTRVLLVCTNIYVLYSRTVHATYKYVLVCNYISECNLKLVGYILYV